MTLSLNCDFQARGDTEDEVLRQAATHARTAHQITEMLPELAAQVRAAIRSVP